jgi:hypothetical protein
MPVNIVADEEVGECYRIDECQFQTAPNIIIASVQYGEPIPNIELQIENRINQIQYPEFMQFTYSWLGEFVYNKSMFRLESFILNNECLTPSQQSAFLLENRTFTVLYSMNSRNLHKIINGDFIAIIEITVWSLALNVGIKVNYKWDVTCAPVKPDLITCNHNHIYRIVAPHVLDCSGSNVYDCCSPCDE